ncbi:MAG: hypothetical protein K8R60_06930 [Burkholderiales bacterium]|nr:hypothetical protein [Burkholderiales bacterium]
MIAVLLVRARSPLTSSARNRAARHVEASAPDLGPLHGPSIEHSKRPASDLPTPSSSCRGFVLDPRNDPGGLLERAIAISEAFLPANAVVVQTNGRLGEAAHTGRPC